MEKVRIAPPPPSPTTTDAQVIGVTTTKIHATTKSMEQTSTTLHSKFELSANTNNGKQTQLRFTVFFLPSIYPTIHPSIHAINIAAAASLSENIPFRFSYLLRECAIYMWRYCR